MLRKTTESAVREALGNTEHEGRLAVRRELDEEVLSSSRVPPTSPAPAPAEWPPMAT